MAKALTPQQLESYRHDGVLFPIPVLSAGEVSYYRAAFEELERRLGGGSRLAPHQVSQWHLHFPWAHRLATHPRVLDVVEDIVGPNVLVHSSTFFCKHPHDASFVSWHQDGFYWQLNEPRLTSAWIALRESTAENGCLRVIPGSHRQARLPHAATAVSRDNLLGSGLEVSVEVDERQARDVLLAAGEMSCHHVDLIHGSSPNRTDGKRIGFAVRYLAPELRQQGWHHEVVLARGRDDYRHYRHAPAPHGNDLEEQIAAQIRFGRRLREIRSAHQRPG